MDKTLDIVYKGGMLLLAVLGTIVALTLYFPNNYMTEKAAAERRAAIYKEIELVKEQTKREEESRKAEIARVEISQVREMTELKGVVNEIRLDVKRLLTRTPGARAGL